MRARPYPHDVRRAWQAYLLWDWRFGEALGGVLYRFLTFWLAFVLVGAILVLVREQWSSMIGLPVWLSIFLWIYQPAKIFRRRKFADSSVPRPARR